MGKSRAISDGNGLSVYFMDVTPEIAQKLLKKNIGNRDVRPGMVKRFAQDIEAGHWLANGQPIHITKGSIFGNGQHRLQAIIETGQTLRMLVVEGLTEDALDTIDEGNRKTPSDRLKRRGVKRYKLVSASLNAIRIVTNTRKPIGVRDFWGLYSQYKSSFDWACKSVPEGHPATWSSTYGALVFAHHAHPTKVAMFFADALKVRDREGGDPVGQFLRVIENVQFEKNDYNTRIQTSRRVLACIKAYVQGDLITKVLGTKEAVDFFLAVEEKQT